MSGFFGIIRSDGAAVEQALLERVGRALEFRGPDGMNISTERNAGFVLAFTDTGTQHQSRTQPIVNHRYQLVGEVRLDARSEIVAELRENGQPTGADACDEELLVRCWNLWGQACLQKILGDFSFGLWNAESQSLDCARDFAGARPFYYAQGPGVFCFSNTLQALRFVPEISGDLDELFIRDFLLKGQSNHPERTVWRAARRLPPGHSLRLSKGQLEVRRFRQLPIEEPLFLKRPEDYLEGFRSMLGRATSDRMPAGRVAFYLSGGLDSASVCAMAARVAPEWLRAGDAKAFTISWRPLLDDPEPENAMRTARYLGLNHEVLQDKHILPDDESQTAFTPEPTAEFFFSRARRLYGAISAHSRVVLAGDGGDNVLDGQAWPYLKYLWRRREWKEIARSFGVYTATHRQLPALRGGFRTRLRTWFPNAHASTEMPVWLNPEFAMRIAAAPDEETQPLSKLPVHPVHPQAYRGLHSGFWGSVLEEEDTGWTGVPLESRAPFLDLRLLQFLLRLPPVPWCMHKELTRQALRDLLPVEILRRKKTPLIADPLQACQRKAGWQPQVMKNLPKQLGEFVEWRSWLATLENSKGLLLLENLYPLALARWLKAIENVRGIQ